MNIKKHKKIKYTKTSNSEAILQLIFIHYLLNFTSSSILRLMNANDTLSNDASNPKVMLVEAYIACLILTINNKNIIFTIISRKKRNKMMHYMNGNRTIQKTKKHLKLFQLNKGSSFIDTNKSIIKDNIVKSLADIAVLGEAQVGRDSNTLTTDYPDYNLELKFMDGAIKSRIAVLVKKGVTY